MSKPVTICVLTYGDYPDYVRRCIQSITEHCERWLYRLVVGANAPSPRVRAWLETLERAGVIDKLHVSETNLNKCPLMRRMREDVDGEFLWWFDDDSYVTEPGTLSKWLEIARSSPPETAMWGHVWFAHEEDFNLGTDVSAFVRQAPWYRGIEPPSRRPGGDPRWFFATGGLWMIRSSALRALDWPDPALVKRADDVLLGEAVRQQGWRLHDLGELGVRINQGKRRGGGEDAATMRQQMSLRGAAR